MTTTDPTCTCGHPKSVHAGGWGVCPECPHETDCERFMEPSMWFNWNPGNRFVNLAERRQTAEGMYAAWRTEALGEGCDEYAPTWERLTRRRQRVWRRFFKVMQESSPC